MNHWENARDVRRAVAALPSPETTENLAVLESWLELLSIQAVLEGSQPYLGDPINASRREMGRTVWYCVRHLNADARRYLRSVGLADLPD